MATSFYQVKNNAKTTITNNPLTAGGLSITLASSTGSKFPTTGNTWLGTIWDAVTYPDPSDDPNMEIVLIDSRSTDTLTVIASGRGFAGTTGVEHATGSAFRLLFTKEHADQWSTAINALEADIEYSRISTTSFHKARAERASTQQIGTASTTALSFLTTSYESDTTMWDVAAPTKLVCKKAGKYLITGFASFAANATGIRQLAIKVNGTTDVQSSLSAASADETSQTLSTMKTLAISDYVEMFAYQNSGGNLNVQAGMHLEMTILA